MTGRFTSPAPDELTPEQRGLYQLFASGRRAQPGAAFSLVDESGRLQGPPAAWVLVPPVGHALEQLGGAMRYELTLPARAREIAILLVAHHHRSPFELHAHTRAGAAAGLSPEDLDALAAGQPPALVTETERVTYAVTRRLLADGALDDDEYKRAAGELGPGRLFELTTLIGYYAMLALQLSVFALVPPEERGEDGDPGEPR
jgi:alkylhydroperoxidase family enzyme